jgi:hypothetical protein
MMNMKKFKFLYILPIALLITLSCEQEVITLDPPPVVEVPPITGTKGTADFTKFVAIGNSLTAGYQAGALFNEGQQNSLPLILSKQFSIAQGTALTFNQPDINSVNGYYGIAGTKILGRLILFDSDGAGPKTVAPAPAGSTGMPAPYTGGDIPTAYTGDKTKLNNFGVPGILLGQALIPDTGNPASPYYNGLWARFASAPGVKSILQDAIAAQPSFFMFDLGNNDVLGYAVGGGSNAAIFTSEAAFQGYYSSAIGALLASLPNAKGVVANIPNVTTIPYFLTVTWNAIALDAATSGALTAGLATGHNAFIEGMKGAGIITQAEADKRKLSFIAGKNGVLLTDETLTDLTPYMMANPATQALVPYARARQATASDLITLSAGSILGTALPGSGGTAVYGVSYPVGDQYVLIPTETSEIKARTIAFNNIIKGIADANATRIALADVNAAFTTLVTNKAGVYNGVTITPNFAPPTGVFSEDGVHPNSRGYSFMANVFIDAINTKFTATIPKASIADYKGTGLPVSAQ